MGLVVSVDSFSMLSSKLNAGFGSTSLENYRGTLWGGVLMKLSISLL